MGTLAGVKYSPLPGNKKYAATGLSFFHPSKIVVASSYAGNRVTEIATYAFFNKKRSPKAVTIEAGIEIINNSAFSWCEGIREITLPRSLTTIGAWAFQGCKNITEITIPNGVKKIGKEAFKYTGLRTVFIPESVDIIEQDAFAVPGLKIYCAARSKPSGWDSKWNGESSVTWSSEIRTNKETGIAEPVRRLTVNEKIKDGVPVSENLGMTLYKDGKSYVVSGIGACRDEIISIPSEYLGKPVTSIANRAFKGNNKIRGVVIPNTVTFLGEKAFYECSELEGVSLPDSIKFIGHGAFGGCTSISEIEIPETVDKIGVWAFKDCKSLETVFISANVGFVGAGAFEGCSSLTIDCDNHDVPQGWDEGWNPDERPINWVAKKGKSVL